MKTANHIAGRIRLMIATKQFQVGEVLPSTRALGKQLNTSFHTVRKAYQMLSEEGLLNGETGRGYVVTRQNTLLDKSDRLEKGAEKFRSLLEELIGYGLDEEEVETLFQEQLNFMDWPERINSCATVASTREIAGMLSDTIKREIGVKSQQLSVKETHKAVNYDALFVPVEHYRNLYSDSENIILMPVIYSVGHELIISIIERTGIRLIGILALEESSIPHLSEEIRHSLKFPGTITGGSLAGRSLPVFVHDVDLLLYTPGCAALVEKIIPQRKRAQIVYELSSQSAQLIRSELWDDY